MNDMPSHPDGKVFIIYDDRAAGGETDEAQVYTVSDTLREARRDAKEWGVPCLHLRIRHRKRRSEERAVC